MQLDHVILAARDLDAASAELTHAGFIVQPGGRHDGWGTENRLIALPSGQYIELMGVHDREQAWSRGPNGEALIRQIDRHDLSLLGWCIACTDADRLAERLRAGGAPDATTMVVRRGDAEWRLVLAEPLMWRRPLPFAVEHPDGRMRPGHPRCAEPHPNGARALSALHVNVVDRAGALRLHVDGLGLHVNGNGSLALGSTTLTFTTVAMSDDDLAQGPSRLVVAADEPDRLDCLARLGIDACSEPPRPKQVR